MTPEMLRFTFVLLTISVAPHSHVFLGGNKGLNKNTYFLSKFIYIQTQMIKLNYLISHN